MKLICNKLYKNERVLHIFNRVFHRKTPFKTSKPLILTVFGEKFSTSCGKLFLHFLAFLIYEFTVNGVGVEGNIGSVSCHNFVVAL